MPADRQCDQAGSLAVDLARGTLEEFERTGEGYLLDTPTPTRCARWSACRWLRTGACGRGCGSFATRSAPSPTETLRRGGTASRATLLEGALMADRQRHESGSDDEREEAYVSRLMEDAIRTLHRKGVPLLQARQIVLQAKRMGEEMAEIDTGPEDDDPGECLHGPSEDWECTHCGGEGICMDGADPLGNCPDDPHKCHACNGHGDRDHQVIF